MAKGKGSNEGCFGTIAVLVVIGVIASIPAGVWIAIGITVGVVLLVVAGVSIYNAGQKQKAEIAAAAAQEQQDRERRAQRERAERLGRKNVKRIDGALAAIEEVANSEAAREGWLGDVDFATDIWEITDRYERAGALRRTAQKLRGLANPNADDRRILAEAQSAADELEDTANELATLIGKCATEAKLIDMSLQKEREEARTAQQRAELHGELSAMLYGIEAAPTTGPADSAAGRVMARVAGYREIKHQIEITRGI